ncbi:uncharacterized protein LOC110441864 [Mizuhopecten yessoensis]|uniref:Hormone receptor 4 n=1 Tax=Mizuhopecten yessoensis TaxID=6573 RepID=A0A210PIH3_MIZYE|nr:uncharacterized protein LOC110441864 [Mizuhopecten yessoensis]OWF36287.1 Hormone receptor 4 [Mizuhopecten yessoensis]
MMTDESVSFPFGKCRICTGKAMGVHYGTATCEGCKAFFKRWMDRDKTLGCYFGGNCVITPDTRHCCKGCRYQKCKENGMSIEAIKMGRIPKFEKRAAIQDFQISRKEITSSCSIKKKRKKEKCVEKKEVGNVFSQATVQDENNSLASIPDREEKEVNAPTNSQEKTGRSHQSSPEQNMFPDFEEAFGDKHTSLNGFKNDSTPLRNVDNMISSYDHHAQSNNTQTMINGCTSSNHQGIPFLDHQAALTDHTPASAQFSLTSGLAPIILNSNRLESDSNPNTSIKTTSRARYLSMDDTSQSRKSAPQGSTSQNNFNHPKYLPRSYTNIPPNVMTNVDRSVDDAMNQKMAEEVPVSTDQNCNTLVVDSFPQKNQKHIDDRDAMQDVLSRAVIEEPIAGVCDVTQGCETNEVLQTEVQTPEISEIGRNSAYLYNYVRLLTDSSLSENECPINGRENDFSAKNNFSFGTQPNDLWSMDNSPTVSAITAGCPTGTDKVDGELAHTDSPQVRTVYLQDSLYSTVENGLDGRDEVPGRGAPNASQPEVQCNSGEFAKSSPSVDMTFVQQDSSLIHETLPSDRFTRETIFQQRNQNDKPRNSAQFKISHQIRLSNLASAIFRSLNGSMGQSDDGTQNDMRHFLRTHSRRKSEDSYQAGIDKERAYKDTDQDETKSSHTSHDTDQTGTDSQLDIRDVMKTTLEVFQRSVDKLYIPIFLKRRLAKKYQHGGKRVKIARRSKEGIGYLMSKLLSEIKTENERITGFAIEIPEFSKLCANDQMLLLKRAFIEIHLLTTSEFRSSDEYFYMEDNDLVLNQAALNTLVDARMVDLMNNLYELMDRFNLSHLEIGLLCAIQLTSLDGVTVEDTGPVGALHSHYLDVFSYMVYSSTRNNKARMVVEVFFKLIPVLKDLSGSINHFTESVLLEQNPELLFRNLL